MNVLEAMSRFRLARQTEVETATLKVYSYTFEKLRKAVGDDKPLAEITVDDLRRWRADLAEVAPGERPKSVYTLHRDVRQIRTFFAWCASEGYLEVNPAARLGLPKLPKGEPPKAISDLDMERMVSAARSALAERPASSDGRPRNKKQGQKPYPYERDYALVRFLAETGCRVGGLVGLQWSDLDLAGQEAIVREKGQKSRSVVFGRETTAALRSWRITQPIKKGGWVFTGERGRLTTSGVYRILERLAERAGVEGRHNPHSFRHALARRLLKHRADMGTVSEILGHEDIETTHRFYARWSTNELRERHKEFGGLLE